MPDARREVLLMRCVDDMSLGEIATALGVPADTVKLRLRFATHTLQQSPRLRQHFECHREIPDAR